MRVASRVLCELGFQLVRKTRSDCSALRKEVTNRSKLKHHLPFYKVRILWSYWHLLIEKSSAVEKPWKRCKFACFGKEKLQKLCYFIDKPVTIVVEEIIWKNKVMVRPIVLHHAPGSNSETNPSLRINFNMPMCDQSASSIAAGFCWSWAKMYGCHENNQGLMNTCSAWV